ncbi:GGDEF domain-containing protein [Frateuria hangzhouensis]|uniref:GGDEF domain-containing protein n=1 Tax=Frateuria hangzhouensis TaxID=2995589 RepID=UPI002260A6D1|nr:GGDEF domain-containing protein [Frateuria sp. STR12]MCX7514515.1 GGDEF domain-containing protein [Frateuria sp. STR12]
MHLDLATLALLGALQALLLAPLLLVATRAYTGVARTSLRIWGVVLLLQALGWILAALRGQVSDWLSIVLANGVLIASYAETTRALRLLLGVPQRRRWLLAIGVVIWLGIVWFGVVQPDYRMRVDLAALMVAAYSALLAWPLRHALRAGGSIAQRVMLLVLVAAAVAWYLRLHELHGDAALQPGHLVPTPGNVVNMLYSAIEPVVASIAFLLMYNEFAQADLRRLARTDPLTGTLNRLGLDEAARQRFDDPHGLAVLMLDADHFKAINDRHGHAGGDRVLAALARCLGTRLRPGDLLGRIGGEEFLVLLPHTGLAAAAALAEDLRAHVASLPLEFDGLAQAITVSIGVAAREGTDANADALVRRADRALYEAKRAGRNRVAGAACPA